MDPKLKSYFQALGVAVGTAVGLALCDYLTGGGDIRHAMPVILPAAAAAARAFLMRTPAHTDEVKQLRAKVDDLEDQAARRP